MNFLRKHGGKLVATLVTAVLIIYANMPAPTAIAIGEKAGAAVESTISTIPAG